MISAGGEPVDYVLNLDDSQFAKTMVGAAERIEGLVGGLESVAAMGGVIGVAFLSAKAALDFSEEAEKLKQINQQFDLLTKNAKLSGAALKEGLIDAAGGIVDDTDLLQAANKSIIEMGSSAAKLPEIMTLARQSSAAFGGDVLQNFERINQAIATGQTRGLRNLGILIDQDKAMREFAKSHGIAANALSETGRQQAILEAVLARGKDRFKDVDLEIAKNTNAWKEFKVAISQAYEASVTFFDRAFGGALNTSIRAVGSTLSAVTNIALQAFGNQTEKNSAKVEVLKQSLAGAERQLAELKKIQENPGSSRFLVPQATIDAQIKKIEELKSSIATIQQRTSGVQGPITADGKAPEASNGSPSQKDLGEKQKLLENERNFQREMLALKQEMLSSEQAQVTGIESLQAAHKQNMALLEEQSAQRITSIRANIDLSDAQKAQELTLVKQTELQRREQLEFEFAQKRIQMQQTQLQTQMSAATSMDQVDEIRLQQKALREEQTALQIQAVRNNTAINEQQKLDEIEQIKANARANEILAQQQLEGQYGQSVQNMEMQANQSADGIAKGFMGAAQRQSVAMQGFAKTGERVFSAFQTNAVNALMAWGSGSKSASEAARGFILGMLGDVAVAEGTVLMLAGIPELNPVKIAGGAALIAFGGYLKSQAQGASAGISSASAGSGGGAAGGNFGSAADSSRPEVKEKVAPRNIQLVIQGHNFETEQFRNKLVDYIREAADATDYRVRAD